MTINFNRTPEQVELVRAMGSKDKVKAAQAMEAFAAFISPIIQTVLNQSASSSLIYTDLEFDEDDSPSIPVELYFGKVDNFITVWTQNHAGGLPSSQVTGLEELKLGTYNLTSAVHWLTKYARKARLDVIAAAVNRMIQEVKVKQERNAWATVLKAVAEGSNAQYTGTALTNVIAASTADQLVLHDFNRLLTRAKRIYTSFSLGTPDAVHGITDMFFSPEMMQEIRGFCYQPMNTVGRPNSDESTSLGLPDSVRESIYKNAGTAEIFGIELHELLEFGDGQKYNALFKAFYTGTFTAASDQVVLAVDRSRANTILRPVAIGEGGGQVRVSTDDQWPARSEKQGLYLTLSEGRTVLDSRPLTAITV